MPDIFNSDDRAAILRRIESVHSESPRQWGRMTPHQMLCHTADQIRCSVGEKPFDPVRIGMPMWLVKFFVFYVPWQKNLPTAPDFDADKNGTRPTDFSFDKAELVRLVRLLGDMPRESNLAPHPGFGPLTKKQWGKLIYRHLDWHLKQFSA